MQDKRDIKIEIAEKLPIDVCNQLADVQHSAWGMSDVDIVPPWKLFVTPKIGSHVIVAYDDDMAIGFALLNLAQRVHEDTKPWLYLDMLGVRRDYQSRGLGFQIMTKAKELMKRCGYAFIAWTFDPLEAANANVYLRKLGAVATAYYPNYFGELTGERHQGSPTDRFWTVLNGDPSPCSSEPQQQIAEVEYETCDEILDSGIDPLSVEIPRDFASILKTDPERSDRIRSGTKHIFQTLFAKGYVVCGFQLYADTCCYIAKRSQL